MTESTCYAAGKLQERTWRNSVDRHTGPCCKSRAGRISSAISRLLQLRRLISRMFWCAAGSRLSRIAPVGGQLGFARQEAGAIWTADRWPRDCAPPRTSWRQRMLEGGSGVPPRSWARLLCNNQAPETRMAPMDKYIGIDVHAASCTIAVVDASGKQTGSHVPGVANDRLQAQPSQIRQGRVQVRSFYSIRDVFS